MFGEHSAGLQQSSCMFGAECPAGVQKMAFLVQSAECPAGVQEMSWMFAAEC